MGARNAFQIIVFLSCILIFGTMSATSLEVDYYKCKQTCPQAEEIVKGVVYNYVSKEPGLGAGLIRMFFHDCFVRGCDASVLLDPSELNPNPEKLAVPNNPSLRGFEVIDDAKLAVEHVCPGVVSCADIIAFAARDAAYILGSISYEIPSGRLDGRVSNADEVLKALPAPFHNLTVVKALFAAQGLSTNDVVALSGAHSIGRSHCSSFTNRLYPTIDPTMDESFGYFLRGLCPENAPVDGVVTQDFVTPTELDNQYYQNVADRKGLFFSDWSLLTSVETASLLNDFRTTPGLFEAKFAESMVNMGNIAGSGQGEIRRICRAVNY
ncbi:Peroxidase [Rhynchospora pubera]|uniref:Peroxidase n=2 Tax=Rhynchospora pubera TaxID=906938 RepID=A0AAV8H5X6_9POAL|nr:Peroxidase [Rhynchospora pubera]KAJ4810821.1 Peroxidase [Rhynchospora pubera]